MVYPLLPAFITGVLGGGAVALGALDGAADAAAALVKLVSGRLADRPARRGSLIVAGYFIAAAVRPIIAVTAAAWQVIGLRVVDRLGKGLRSPPRDALIADVTPAPLVGRAFGLQRGLDHVGAVIGPLVAWWMLSSGADVRKVIVASLGPGVLVLVLAMWAVKGGEGRRGAAKEAAAKTLPPSAALRRLPPPIIAISLFYLLRMPETLMILRAQRLGIPVALIPLLWAALHVVRSSTSFAGGALSDRIGPARTMWIGWLVYAVSRARHRCRDDRKSRARARDRCDRWASWERLRRLSCPHRRGGAGGRDRLGGRLPKRWWFARVHCKCRWDLGFGDPLAFLDSVA